MAHNLVTQVSRPEADVTQKKEKGLLSSIFCCFTNNNNNNNNNSSSNTTGAQPTPVQNGVVPVQQQQQQQQHAIHYPGQPDPGYGLLPEMQSDVRNKKCVVLDLDETLVHSSFKPVPNADYVVPIEIDNQQHHVYVLKRPHVDQFLAALAVNFEVVLFTASLSKYADPVTDLLDPQRVCRYRLFREHCVYHRGTYVKDLSRLGRDLSTTVLVDNSPASYIFQPDNAVGCISWFDDPHDTELLDMLPFFERLAQVDDVTTLRWNRDAKY